MATWKKVIVSGSNAELHHITASGNISASGYLFGNLPSGNHDEVVIYNTTTGRLEFKVLNLVSANRAPEVYMIDTNRTDTTRFYLSFDSGSPTQPITAPTKPSASEDGTGGSYSVVGHNTYALSINNGWDDVPMDHTEYYSLVTPTNQTQSVAEGNVNGPNDVRVGLITGTGKQNITLYLNRTNNDDSTATPAYTPGPAYGNAGFDVPPGSSTDTASIRVYLNTNVNENPTAEFFLTASTGNPSITTVLNGITAAISPSASNISTALDPDATKSWRSGSITIGTSAQVDGYNYAFVVYTGSRSDGTVERYALTNFVEWFYDNDGAGQAMGSTAIPDADVTLSGFPNNDYTTISGIRYYNETAADDALLEYYVTQSNQYRNIYPHASDAQNGFSIAFNNTGISGLSVTQSGAHVLNGPYETTEGNTTPQQVPLAPLADINNAHLSNTNITASFTLDFDEAEFHHPATFLGTIGSRPWGDLSNELDLTAAITFQHPNKTNKTRSAGTIDSYLVNDLDSTDETNGHNLELFRSESYRLISRSYASSDTMDSSLYDWDGSANIVNGGGGHNNGALIYHSYLCYPTYAGENSTPGRFNSTYGPTQANNYSSGGTEATGVREYYRYFKLISGQNGQKAFNLEFKGSGKIVHNSSTLFASDTEYFKLEVLRSAGGGSSLIGSFIDPLDNDIHNADSIEDSPDTRYIPLTNTAANINYSAVESIGGVDLPRSVVKVIDDANASSTSIGEFIVVRIIVPEGWTGYIDAMALTIGTAPTPILPSQSPF